MDMQTPSERQNKILQISEIVKPISEMGFIKKIIEEEKRLPMILSEQEISDIKITEINRKKEQVAKDLIRRGKTPEEIIKIINRINFDSYFLKNDFLIKANGNKHFELEFERIKQKKLIEKFKRIEQEKIYYNKSYYYHFAKKNADLMFKQKRCTEQFNVPQGSNRLKVLQAICYLLSEDEGYENVLKFSFDKGLLIRSKSGQGKSFNVNLLYNNEYKPISIHSMIDISDTVRREGFFKLPSIKKGFYHLDDVGTEKTPIKHFGTEIEWFKDMVEVQDLRYGEFTKFIISTNLNYEQIGEKYGFRVERRIREKFNVLDLL